MEQLAEMQDSGTALPAADESIDTSVDTSTSPEDVIDSPESETLLPGDDDEEIDYDGEKYKVPAKLKEAFMRQQDYTQKTQSVAEQRKAVEAQAVEIQQRAQQQQAHIAEYAEALSLDNELKKYQGIDWNALVDSDPVQAMKLDRQMRDLQQRRDQVVSSVTQKQQQQALQMQQETAKRLQEGRAVLEREIKGWSPELGKQLSAYGQEIGFSAEELANVTNPNAIKLLHKAWQFDQLMKKSAAQKEKPAPQEKPVTRITASQGTATKTPSQMTDREFAKWRQTQIKNRNK
jgi:hypothetical protein